MHLPYEVLSIKLITVTAAGSQFGPPGYETDLPYLACLAAVALGGPEPLATDNLIGKSSEVGDVIEKRTKLTRHGLAGKEPHQLFAIDLASPHEFFSPGCVS